MVAEPHPPASGLDARAVRCIAGKLMTVPM
jgi:hypothetical protein